MLSLTMAGANHKLKAQLTHRNNLLIAPCSQGLPLRFPQGFLGRLSRSQAARVPTQGDAVWRPGLCGYIDGDFGRRAETVGRLLPK
jgi:hypothetical protein